MFDKYKANEITKMYMEKYAELKHLLELSKNPESITSIDLQTKSMLNVYIEPTNRCNLNCAFCARENVAQNFHMLNMESYKKTIDSLPKGTYITLTGHGEPTINVNVYDMISYASQKGMFTSLITNASTLNDKNRKKLINSGISRIQLSFQSLDKNTNEFIMKGTIFGRELLYILKLIYEIRKEQKKIYISISRVNIKESAVFAEITKQFWEKIPIDNYYEGELLSLQDGSKMLSKNETEFNKYMPCGIPWISAQINANGEVTACIQDWSSKYVLGNINEHSLIEILNTSKAIQFRHALLIGNWDYLESIGYGACKECNTWQEKVNGNIEGIMNCSLPVRMGLVINEIAADKPTNTEFLEQAIEILESGETDLIHKLMEK